MPKYVKIELAIYDIHAKPEIHAFGDFVRPLYLSSIASFAEELSGMPDHETITIGYPDEGAWKRFEEERELLARWPHVRCSKERVGDEMIMRVVEGDPAGRHVVLIDDIIETARTAFMAGLALQQAGAKYVSLFGAHAVCSGGTWKRFMEPTNIFKHVWLSDSIPVTCAAVRDRAPFKVVSLAPDIARIIKEFCL